MIQHSCSARVQWPRLADFRTLTEICKNDIILIVSRFSAKAQEARELIENRSKTLDPDYMEWGTPV